MHKVKTFMQRHDQPLSFAASIALAIAWGLMVGGAI